MKQVIHGGVELLQELQSLMDDIGNENTALIPLDEVTWLPPVPEPGKICCVAMNNSASNVRKISAPEHPAFFLKPSSCLVAHMSSQFKSVVTTVVFIQNPNWQLSLGKTAKDVLPEDAYSSMCLVIASSMILPVTECGQKICFIIMPSILKKITSDEVEKVEQHLSYAARYKGTDHFGSFGPWIANKG